MRPLLSNPLSIATGSLFVLSIGFDFIGGCFICDCGLELSDATLRWQWRGEDPFGFVQLVLTLWLKLLWYMINEPSCH